MRRRQLLEALLLVRHLSTLAPWRPQPLARMVFRHHGVCSRTGVVFRRLWCGSISNAGRASRGSREATCGLPIPTIRGLPSSDKWVWGCRDS